MTATLDRTTFTFKRMMEYFSINELQAQTGQSYINFPVVIVKELVDNALDECESGAVKPEVEISAIQEDDGTVRITIADNGKGIPPETIEKILDFDTRTTSKAFYRTPTRGQLGNALKTVIGIPYALSQHYEQKEAGKIEIISKGIKHTITTVEYAGQPQPKHTTSEFELDGPGTVISIKIPIKAMYAPSWNKDCFTNIKKLVYGYALLNPHSSIWYIESRNILTDYEDCTIETQGWQYESHAVADSTWRKFYSTDLPSPHWFTADSLRTLVHAHIQNGAIKPFGTFIREFRGLSSSVKAKAVSHQFKGVKTIADLRDEKINDLLTVMKESTKPPSPSVLGAIGPDALRARLSERGDIRSFWYKKIEGTSGDLPFVVEAAAAVPGSNNVFELHTGINFSPTYDDPFKDTWFNYQKNSAVRINGTGIRGLLKDLKVYNTDSFIFVLHLTTPVVDIRDRAKSNVFIPNAICEAIAEAAYACCKEWYAEKKRAEKDAAKEERQIAREEEEQEKKTQEEKCDLNDAVFQVLPAAIDKVSDGERLPIPNRNLFYAVRDLLKYCPLKRDELTINYFNDLVDDYESINGPIHGLTKEPRGEFIEPHTEVIIPLGTVAVHNYEPPEYLFNKILYVEKRGFNALFKATKLPEKYDMGIAASQGYAVEACKELLRKANTKEKTKIICLHDCDVDGLMIKENLEEGLVDYNVEVIDIGFSVKDALARNLDPNPEKKILRKQLPKKLREQLTHEEQEFLLDSSRTYYGENGKRYWYGNRVELNAMTAAQFIEYIEDKLREHGLTPKVCPPDDVINRSAKATASRELRSRLVDEVTLLLNIEKIANSLAASIEKDIDLSTVCATVKEELATQSVKHWRDIADGAATWKVVDAIKAKKEFVKKSVFEWGRSPC